MPFERSIIALIVTFVTGLRHDNDGRAIRSGRAITRAAFLACHLIFVK
jgi:hypothetical protein